MKKGFTLLEVAIATGILTIAFLGLLASLQSPFTLNETAKETTIALKDASRVFEEVLTTSFSTITTTNWTTWAQNNGLTHLVNEALLVTTSGSDPLNITVEVRWTSYGGRGSQRRFVLATRRTS